MRGARPRRLAVAALLPLALVTAACGTGGEPGPPTVTAAADPRAGEGRLRAEVLVEDLEVPWGLAFLPSGSALVTERETARLLEVSPRGEVTEVAVLDDADPAGEGGLLGVAVSPSYDEDRAVFLYLTAAEENRVVRATYEDGVLGPLETVLDGIPKGQIHDGGRLAFGPDGHLYVSTGEIGDPALAQEADSLAGKVLRITPDGAPAPGNPDEDSPVFTLGHRNVQGLAWDDDGRLWATEFGSSVWDELNELEVGENYGWPEVEGRGEDGDLVDPRVVWPVELASPSGLAWAEDSLWVAALRGRRLWEVPVVGGEPQQPVGHLVGQYGRLRTVVPAPDGSLWVTTSNRDGRGEPVAGDDRILVVRP